MNNLENEDIFTDYKEKSTQSVENIDTSTQTGDDENPVNQSRTCQTQTQNERERREPSTNLTNSLAMLANRFLHSAYWFLSLGLVFSSHSLPNLKHNTSWRQDITRDSARRILSLLMRMDSHLLVDVARPSLVVTECTVAQAVEDMRDLDRWLLDSLKEVVLKAREEGVVQVLDVLEQMMEEQKMLVEESLEMNSRKFITLYN